MLLKELCEQQGVSGNEKNLRDYILKLIKGKVNSYKVDKIGNLLAENKSADANPFKIVLLAHMDEVGLLITDITSEGYLKFQPVGGINPQTLVAKTIKCGQDQILGVIGSKAIHLQKPEDRKKNLNLEDLYIDIGANSKEEAEEKVKIGDYAFFTTKFEQFNTGLYKAKAFDDRVGCAIIIEILASKYNCDLIAAFTVQEEVGLRGSKVISNYLEADLAIVIEATNANDLGEKPPEERVVELGKGPALSLMDSATIYKSELIRKVTALAADHQIPLQFRKGTAAANDAGNIHQAGKGIPTITLSVPCRYIHSPNSLIYKGDYENCRKLVQVILNNSQVFCSK
ncbi:MAG TPA: M42 family metallopeptidase [Peptococcaceae bacterium]|nr:M42 family metallopeptidase [Peptococcaceae bacterium]